MSRHCRHAQRLASIQPIEINELCRCDGSATGVAHGATATEKLRDKLTKLFAMLGSNIADEREVARCKIDDLLAKNKKNWNDLVELLSTGNAQGWQDQSLVILGVAVASMRAL